MAKKLLQDMKPKRSAKKKQPLKGFDYVDNKLRNTTNTVSGKRVKQRKSRPRNPLWFIAFISILFLFFAVSSLFSNATITIKPRVQDFTLDTDFSAIKDLNNSSALSFSLISLSGEESKVVLSGEEQEYNKKAKGKVVIYNNFSSNSQRLAINTRLEGSNGKIYKTEKAVTVPGITQIENEAGEIKSKPGSVEVTVFASEAGEEYNTPPVDFNIVGFKGTPKYTKFYARSKGDITGGLKGKLRLVSEEDKIKAIGQLKIMLKNKLFKKATEQLPEGYIFFKDGVIFKVDDEDIAVASVEREVPIKIRGTLYGFLFKEENLTNKIIETIIPDYKGKNVYIPNIKNFTFSLNLKPDIYNFSNIKTIKFNLSGDSKIVWDIDETELTENLLDKSKKEFKEILSRYSNIDSADLTIRPVWRRKIPSKEKRVEIIVNEQF